MRGQVFETKGVERSETTYYPCISIAVYMKTMRVILGHLGQLTISLLQ
jgi:hypothetical protein